MAATITSLIVRIGAQDTEISAALDKLVANARRADTDLSKLGDSPIAQKAIADTAKLAENIKQITDQQQKFAEKAVNAAVGVETLGGASKLMAGQLDQVAIAINKGLDAFRALGQEAPKDLQRVADAVTTQQAALKQAAASTNILGEAQSKAGGFTNLLANAQTALVAQLGLVAGPAALGFAAKAAVDYADKLTKLSDQTGIGVVSLQRLGAIAQASGNSLEDISGAVNKFQKNISEGTPAAVTAILRLGVSIEDLKRQSPDEQFITIAKAIQKIPDPATQAAIAMEIFGKSGAQLLPTLKGDIDKLADSTVTMSAASVKALDDFGDHLGALKTSTINAVGEIAGAFLRAAGAAAEYLQKARDALTVPLPTDPAARDRQRLQNALISGPGAFRNELTAQQPGFGQPILSGRQFGVNASVLGNSIGLAPGQASATTDALQKIHDHITALDRAAQALGLSFDEYEKKLGEVDAKINAAERDTGHLTDTQQKSVLRLRELGLGYGDIAIKLGVSELAIKAYDDGLTANIARMSANTTETGKFQQELGKMIVGLDQAGKAVIGFHGVFRTDFDLPLAGAITDLSNTTAATKIFEDQIKRTVEAMQRALATPLGLPNVGPLNTQLLQEAREATDIFADAFKNIGEEIPTILSHAFEGGGGLSGALKSIATKMGADFAKELNASIAKDVNIGGSGFSANGVKAGGALGAGAGLGTAIAGGSGGQAAGAVAGTALGVGVSAIAGGATIAGAVALGVATAGIGLAAVAAYYGLKKLFGASEESKINPLRQSFIDAAGGLDALNKHAHEVGLTLDELLNAKNADQYNTAISKLSDAFAVQAKQASDLSDAVGGIVAAAQGVGNRVPSALQPVLAKLIDMKGLTDDERQALKNLAAQGPDFASLEQTASDLGISLEQLGPVFEQQHIDTVAHQYQDAFDQLTDAGADVGGVLTGLSPKINALLSDATKFGSSVPKSMQPMLEKMLALGLLTDDSGKKLDTLAGFNFDDSKSPLDKSLDNLTTAINTLADLLKGLPDIAATAAGGIQGAFDGVHPEITVDVNFDDGGGYRPEANYASTGGRVTTHGIQMFSGGGQVGRLLPFVPRGKDTQLIGAAPGEIILNEAQQGNVAAGLAGSGQGYDDSAMRAQLAAAERRAADRDRRLPALVAMQVKAVIAKAG